MAARLQIDEKGTYIPDSQSWMYDQANNPRMTLLKGLELQQSLCTALIGRITNGDRCNIPLSVENLTLNLDAFKRDFQTCRAWVSYQPGQIKPLFFEKYTVLMAGQRSSVVQKGPPCEAILLEQAEALLKRLVVQCNQIPFISLEHKIGILQRSVLDPQRQQAQSQDAQKGT